MSSRYLAVLEVSQKQAYIFSSNELKKIIDNSKQIAWVTSWKFLMDTIKQKVLFSEANRVYEGGGHAILQFTNENVAKEVISMITKRIIKAYPSMEVFAKLMEYQEENTPAENVQSLLKKLEDKKSNRKASFHQGTFGLEKIDPKTLDVVPIDPKTLNVDSKDFLEIKIDDDFLECEVPEGFVPTDEFKNLGGSKNESNFIAVVHIDGNGMGDRVDQFGKDIADWDTYCKKMKEFSDEITEQFKAAYVEMTEDVAAAIHSKDSIIKDTLDLQKDKDGKTYFPIRQIILAGDDVSFVAEGRLGIEAAVSFIEHITEKQNKVDQKTYNVCAGVTLVHQKYPFYRAYELAEELCKNAKKLGASLSPTDNGASVSSIDWHIEYGEIKSSVKEIRKDYRTYEKEEKQLELRPYIVCATDEIKGKEPIRQYDNFRRFMKKLETGSYGSGILKNLRSELKRGLVAADHYLRFHQVTELGKDLFYNVYQETDFENAEENIKAHKESDYVIFTRTADGKIRSTMFDGIEIMDTYLRIKED